MAVEDHGNKVVKDGVTTKATVRRRGTSWWRKRRFLLLGAGVLLVTALVVSVTLVVNSARDDNVVLAEAPEAARILEAQQQLEHLGILIPAYLPKGYKRAGVEIDIQSNGPSGEPMIVLSYRKSNGDSIFLRQWVPPNPQLEVLVGSKPVETKWGQGWLLTQLSGMVAVWVDIGSLRVSVSAGDRELVSREQLVQIANTLGLASDEQVYSFSTELPQIQGVEPPPPFEVGLNADGVQELNLTITPGGYSPIRFAVQKGIPVKVNFRALGQVGCGNVLIFPSAPDTHVALELSHEQTLQVLEFTPQVAGDFQFQCTNNCFRGIMTVREGTSS